MSIFPPHNIGTTFFPGDGFLLIKYASPAAPAGSTTDFDLSINKNIALMISLSSTSTISSILSLIISNVCSPGVLTDIPSATVNPPSIVSSLPESNYFFIEGNDFDSTPMTFTFGFLSLIATKTPATNPPPPIGT